MINILVPMKWGKLDSVLVTHLGKLGLNCEGALANVQFFSGPLARRVLKVSAHGRLSCGPQAFE